MRLRTFCLLVLLGQAGSVTWAVEADPLDRRVPTAQRPTAAAANDPRGKSSVTAKGPLPDPALLDGSNQPPEKKSEYGMLGEFEMPGGEEKSDRVGGQQQQSGGSQGAKGEKNAQQGGGGGQQQASAGGASSQGAEQGASGGAGGAQSQDKNGGSAGSIAQNDPNAKADGAQSSGLSSPDGGAAAPQSDAMPSKPGAQKIGDATMQIKTMPSSAASSVVGLTQPVGKDVPQAYDAKTPGGGKQSGGSGNKGVEKGRTMPAGL